MSEPLTTAKPYARWTREEFFSTAIARNTDKDGNAIDPGLMKRLEHPYCLECQEQYKTKFATRPRPFQIQCQGIYDDAEFHALAEGSGLSYDEVRESLDVSFWANLHVVVNDENGEPKPFQSRWYQDRVLRCTARRKVSRMGRGLGKALAVDTHIPTPGGWTTMADLKPGDQVFDETGAPCTVTFVTPVMYGHACSDVVFSDGSILTADDDHQWETWTHAARKAYGRYPNRQHPRVGPSTVTTRTIRETLHHGTGKRAEHNHSIKVSGPLQYPEQILPIDPYVLGLWLGDGSKYSAQLTCVDLELLNEVLSAGYAVSQTASGYLPNGEVRAPNFNIGVVGGPSRGADGRFASNDSLTSKLKELGVICNKHIPEVYLHAAIHQRLALLQGLMDTDGNIRKAGWAEFDNTNKLLADGVAELAVSLGLKVSRSQKPAILNGVAYGIDYRIGFQASLEIFRLPRKRSRLPRGYSRPTIHRRYIIAVRPVESVAVKCIQVDSPSHLYLAGHSCIPTHNTLTGIIEELHILMTRKGYDTLVVTPAKSQVEQWYTEINRVIGSDTEMASAKISERKSPFYRIQFSNDARVSLFTAGSDSGKEAKSLRSQSPRRVRVDEQDYLEEADYKAIMPLLRRYRDSEFHGASTPTGAHSTFWQMCTQMDDYREFHYPITVHPDWGPEMEARCRSESGTEEQFLHEWMAEFTSIQDGVYKSHHITAAIGHYRYCVCPEDEHQEDCDCPYQPNCEYIVGADWNGEGTGTRIRVAERDNATGHIRCVSAICIDAEQWTNKKAMEELVRINRLFHAKRLFLDRGYGHAQEEMLRLIGHTAKFNNGNSDDARLLDLREVDFGASLETNSLVKRGKEAHKDRRTKPFLVENSVIYLEQRMFEFSSEDSLLENQLREYRVKKYSAHGYANTYESGPSGDHDLDAMMLALLGFEMEYGLEFRRPRRFAFVEHFNQTLGETDRPLEQLTQVPRRTENPFGVAGNRSQKSNRMDYIARRVGSSVFLSPQQSGKVSPIDRTSAFRKPPGRRFPFTPYQNRVP